MSVQLKPLGDFEKKLMNLINDLGDDEEETLDELTAWCCATLDDSGNVVRE